MSNRKNLAYLRRQGISLNAAHSCGGGNRGHRAWYVEFVGEPLSAIAGVAFVSLYVRDCGGDARFDGKRYCEQLAVANAIFQLAQKLSLDLPEPDPFEDEMNAEMFAAANKVLS